jgi:hypothetical protein
MVLVRQRSLGVPLLPSTGCEAAIQRIAFPQPYAMGQRTNPLIEQELEEAAMPGQAARAHAHCPIAPGNSPSRIANCHQRHRNRRSASVQSSNVFAEPTLRHNVARRNRKTLQPCEQAVEDATSLWNAEENAEEILLTSKLKPASAIVCTLWGGIAIRKGTRRAPGLIREPQEANPVADADSDPLVRRTIRVGKSFRSGWQR